MRILLLYGALLLAGSVEATPRVQTLVPGMVITPLPIEIANIDSLEYGPDGNLYLAGYDGRIHVLRDTDGDGVEDQASVYWDEPGDLLTPVGIAPRPEGVYVAARGKIALVKDIDGDGVGDVSETIVSGWERESYNSDTRNDAAGLTMDAEGNLYFSLGCMSYNKAWRLDASGQSQYDPSSERGTILKVSPDRARREILATGLRFVIGLEFNRYGDLFATDQEGDTWFPGGNPRDELLHIVPGRSYGFPFRHPKYNPNVIDEPYVVGFSPQHQSTCGFRFNETRVNRKPIGPSFWEGNAIVTGFSRGKLWRAPLAKTPFGYVGKQIQLVAFESLLTDVAISDQGTMVVASHSGKPDWGAGPAASGYLHSIRLNSEEPQPVAAWPSGPMESTVAFDRAIDVSKYSLASIEMGEHAWEGDRYEWIWPGYDVVKAEKAAPRRRLSVDRMTVTSDRRTIQLTTAPHPWDARYRVELNGGANTPLIELSYDLGGVAARWTRSGESDPSWTGWAPHLDTTVIKTLTNGSARHAELGELVKESGTLRVTSQLLLPGREVQLRFVANQAFSVVANGVGNASKKTGSKHELDLKLFASDEFETPANPRGGREQVLPTERIPFTMEIETGGDVPLELAVGYQADFDPYWRPLRLEHLFVPWAPDIKPVQSNELQVANGQDVQGDAARGRELFEAACAICHQVDGVGSEIAADLSVSRQRAPEAVLRDIVDPNAAINPDYVSYEVTMNDGKTFSGLVQDSSADALTIVEASTQSTRIPRDKIRSLKVSPTSLMPEGFEALGEERLNDLIAFLCSEEKAE